MNTRRESESKVLGSMKVETLQEMVKLRIQWYGHVLYMEYNRIYLRASEMKMGETKDKIKGNYTKHSGEKSRHCEQLNVSARFKKCNLRRQCTFS
jgi:hypothetical protein